MVVNCEQQVIRSFQDMETSSEWLDTPQGDSGSDPGRLLNKKWAVKVDEQPCYKLLQLWYKRKYSQLQFWFVSEKVDWRKVDFKSILLVNF